MCEQVTKRILYREGNTDGYYDIYDELDEAFSVELRAYDGGDVVLEMKHRPAGVAARVNGTIKRELLSSKSRLDHELIRYAIQKFEEFRLSVGTAATEQYHGRDN
jgi:hypothetical protein